MNDLIFHIILKWKEEFAGTSATELAHELGAEHEQVVPTLKRLASRGLVHLRHARVAGLRVTCASENGTPTVSIQPTGPLDTVIAFPTKGQLRKVFDKEGKDYGFFTNRLHLGDSPIQQYFFNNEVLDKYFKYPDRYHLEDDVIGGSILTRDAYYSAPT